MSEWAGTRTSCWMCLRWIICWWKSYRNSRRTWSKNMRISIWRRATRIWLRKFIRRKIGGTFLEVRPSSSLLIWRRKTIEPNGQLSLSKSIRLRWGRSLTRPLLWKINTSSLSSTKSCWALMFYGRRKKGSFSTWCKHSTGQKRWIWSFERPNTTLVLEHSTISATMRRTLLFWSKHNMEK